MPYFLPQEYLTLILRTRANALLLLFIGSPFHAQVKHASILTFKLFTKDNPTT